MTTASSAPRRALFASALLLAGCGGFAVQVGSPPPAAEAPAPVPSDTARSSKAEAAEEAALRSALQLVQAGAVSYAIGPADLLEITVYQEPDLERKARVSPEGTITLPLAGEVKVGGLTTAQAEGAIVERLKRYLLEPHVSIFIKEYGNKQIYVLGEVQKPGSYPLPTEAPLSVIEAVTLAGGFTQYASQNRTRVIRNADGKSTSIVIEVTAITRKGDKSKDVRLEPNDVVFVPETFF